MIKGMVFIAALFITHLVGAQDASTQTPKFTPEQKAERMTAHLKQQLSLSNEQSEKVKATYLENLQKIESGDQKRKAAHEELEKSMSQILTKDQFEKFKTMEAQRREQMKNHKSQQAQPSPAEQETKPDSSQPNEQK
ncbi:MAG: hypothetical protein ABIT08_11985 [Bacteroidia bacterium]